MTKMILPGALALGAMTPAERAQGRYMRAPDHDSGTGTKSVAELAAETKAAFDKRFGDLDSRIQEVEQKSARRAGSSRPETESLGAAIADDPRLTQFAAERSSLPGRIQVETKAITSLSTSAAALTTQPYRDTVVSLPQQTLSIRDLLTVIPITTGSVEYPHQTGRTNNAGMVAEGTLKPESTSSWEMLNLPVRKIAHWILASSEILADAPQLRATIDSELVYGVAYVEDVQLLKGDGTGQNLTGMIPFATDYVDPLGLTEANQIDTIGTALLQNALADYPADGIVLHPSDWMRMRLLKDSDGKYLLGDPGSAAPPVLFGKRVVETKAMTAGSFLVGQFAVAATLYDRMATTVLVSTEDGDNFRRNMCTILAEERIALAIKRGEALTYGQFD